MIRCPTGALLKLTLQICGACIVFSGCSENGPVIAHVSEITPAPGDSPSNTIADGYSDEYATQYGLVLIKAVTLNNQGYTGKGVRVAVVDTGIDHAHSEFKGRQILGTNFGNDARGLVATAMGTAHMWLLLLAQTATRLVCVASHTMLAFTTIVWAQITVRVIFLDWPLTDRFPPYFAKQSLTILTLSTTAGAAKH